MKSKALISDLVHPVILSNSSVFLCVLSVLCGESSSSSNTDAAKSL
jgi:hypothetical protein